MNSNIQIIRYEECESSLWKNGGGSTKQLLISPKDSDLTNFDYRISIATISSDGPFSIFPGIDRQLCILEGEGVKLLMPENGAKPSELLLRPNQAAFCFSGETQIESQLLDKQIIDFNVMTKRGKYRAYIERLELNGSLSPESSETSYIDDAHQTSNVHNNELQQWLLCLEPLNLVYQGQIIQLKRYDMVQYLQGQDLKAQPSKMKRLDEIETSDATSSDAELPILKHSHIENPSLLNHKQCQVLRIVIECTKKF
ncbi:HutD/Ves family protein [Shewanella cutis]|uniref:HutD family protein n=1 Tax=Shewanella cutis TaxID=2766780 RepID=A0ABS9QQC3_9GAMM|nr:HutD family protein [Shewanella sp. PS-2]